MTDLEHACSHYSVARSHDSKHVYYDIVLKQSCQSVLNKNSNKIVTELLKIILGFDA